MSSKPYDYAHRRARAALLPYAYGKPCPLCGHEMMPDQQLDLDHTRPLAAGGSGPGDRITHASCNRSRGDGTRRRVTQPTSRAW